MAKVRPTAEIYSYTPETKKGCHFFVVCIPGTVEKWKKNKEHSDLSIYDVLDSRQIYAHRSRVKGEPQIPSKSELENAFGTNSIEEIAQMIIERGTFANKGFGGDERANVYTFQPRQSSSGAHY